MTDRGKPAKDKLLTLAQVRREYGYTMVFLRELVHKGRLKAEKVGGRWMTTRADMEAYLASRVKRGRYKEIKRDTDAS